MALLLQVMPDDEVIIWRSVHNLSNLGNAGIHAVSLLAGGLRQAQCRVLKHQVLAITVSAGHGVIGGYLVVNHLHLGEVIAFV